MLAATMEPPALTKELSPITKFSRSFKLPLPPILPTAAVKSLPLELLQRRIEVSSYTMQLRGTWVPNTSGEEVHAVARPKADSTAQVSQVERLFP